MEAWTNGKSATPIKPEYYTAKGSRFYAVPVKNGDVFSLKIQVGYFTANKDYVDLVKKIN